PYRSWGRSASLWGRSEARPSNPPNTKAALLASRRGRSAQGPPAERWAQRARSTRARRLQAPAEPAAHSRPGPKPARDDASASRAATISLVRQDGSSLLTGED